MDLGSPSESAKLKWPPRQVPRKGNVSCSDSSHEVCFPYSVSPLGAAASLVGIASPDRLRLQVFSTSWRLDPPRACWPYLMPDPLMGFRPPEPCSSRAAVRRLRRLYPLVVAAPTVRRPTNPQPTAETIDAAQYKGQRLVRPSPPGSCSTRESATRRRRFRPAGARSSPGLPPFRVFPPTGTARLSPNLPS